MSWAWGLGAACGQVFDTAGRRADLRAGSGASVVGLATIRAHASAHQRRPWQRERAEAAWALSNRVRRSARREAMPHPDRLQSASAGPPSQGVHEQLHQSLNPGLTVSVAYPYSHSSAPVLQSPLCVHQPMSGFIEALRPLPAACSPRFSSAAPMLLRVVARAASCRGSARRG